MRRYLFCLLCFLLLSAVSVCAQEYMFVNTDNLIMRDKPTRDYMVYAILQAPSRLQLAPADAGYKNNAAVNKRFCRVYVLFKDENGISNRTSGWVEKKYLVATLDDVTVPGVDKSIELHDTEPGLISYMGGDKHDPNMGNAKFFQAPEFKGGEKPLLPKKREYHTGPRGGCYYISEAKTRVYVDSKLCKDGQSKK